MHACRYMYGYDIHSSKINDACIDACNNVVYICTVISVIGEHVQEALFASIHTPFHGSKGCEYTIY
jgi:hypothetical protein